MEDLAVSTWKDRNVFVTGASGLLGSWLTERLQGRGATVTCLVRDWVPNSRLVASGTLSTVQVVRGELEDYGLVVRALNEYEVHTIFHVGAQTIVGTAARSALSTFESNIRGTWCLLEAAKTCSKLVERVIVASSDKAYGSHEKLPYTESTPLEGRYPYDVSKSCADLIALSYYHTYGLPVVVTRCGNLFGGGDLNFNRLIPGTIRSVLRGEPPIIRSDGKFIRDYFYVRDAVDAYVLLAERILDGELAGQAFNFGNEAPIPVVEVVARILELMNAADLTPVILSEASSEIREQYLNCAKARDLLDWHPKYDLDTGLSETIDWYRDFLDETLPGSFNPEESQRQPKSPIENV
jgi:CDP-glucose 4,6-dehydratase